MGNNYFSPLLDKWLSAGLGSPQEQKVEREMEIAWGWLLWTWDEIGKLSKQENES